jgi:hypothetical protein
MGRTALRKGYEWMDVSLTGDDNQSLTSRGLCARMPSSAGQQKESARELDAVIPRP